MVSSLIYFADFEAIGGILTGFGLVVVVPVVAMLLSHQRKMAELIHGQKATNGVNDERIALLEYEVQNLKHQLNENIIAYDDRKTLEARIGPPPAPR